MSEKDNITVQVKRLSSETGYYTNVFKKVEKIISVSAYILSHKNKRQEQREIESRLEKLSFSLHDTLLSTLSLPTESATDGLLTLQYQLAGFESTLRIAEAGAVLSSDVVALLVEQIDLVQRYINNHYTKDTGYSLENEGMKAALGIDTESAATKKQSAAKKTTSAPTRRKRVQIPAGDISTDAYLVYSQMTDRAERIKTVLDAKPQATIKDIAEVITDVSEKTIQRELNSLIEKGEVIREGERRWSKYSTVKN